MAPKQLYLKINLFEAWSTELIRRQELEKTDDFYMSSVTASRARLSFYHFLYQFAEDNNVVIKNEKLLWGKSASKTNKNLTPEDFLCEKLDYKIEDSRLYFEEILTNLIKELKVFHFLLFQVLLEMLLYF